MGCREPKLGAAAAAAAVAVELLQLVLRVAVVELTRRMKLGATACLTRKWEL